MKTRSVLRMLELLSLFAIIVQPSHALAVEGVIFDAEVAPGDKIAHEMTVSLGEDESPVDLAVEIDDWGQSEDGVNLPMQSRASPGPYSARGFLTAEPHRFHIEQGGTEKVMLKGIVPKDVGSGGRYALINIYSLPGKVKEDAENSVGISVAVSALARLTIAGTDQVRRGEIEDANMSGISRKHQNLSILFQNTGNCHFKVTAEAILKDRNGNILDVSISPVSSNILPGARRLFLLSLTPEKVLEPGSYLINATAKCENGTLLASKELEFDL
jgi:hypothetical protein